MNAKLPFGAVALWGFLLGGTATAEESALHANALDTAKIEQLTGARDKLDTTDNAFRVAVPRGDLKVTVARVK